MDILLDIMHTFDYDILLHLSQSMRGGVSDTVWTMITWLGNYGALWIAIAVALLFFHKTQRAGIAMLVSLLLNVYFWVMNFGYASYALRMARGGQPGYRRLFDGFAALGRAILVSLLTSIFLSLWGLLFMVPYMVVMILAALLGSMGLMMLAILLLIGGMVMMVIFSYRYRLATYFLLDHPEMGALESITQSKQAMKGWKGELFILDWSFFGWLLLVALVELVGIGLGTLFSPALGTLLGTVAAGAFSLWLNPYMNGTEANFYDWVTHGSLSYRENNGPGGYQSPYGNNTPEL